MLSVIVVFFLSFLLLLFVAASSSSMEGNRVPNVFGQLGTSGTQPPPMVECKMEAQLDRFQNCTHFYMFGTDFLYDQLVLISKISASELSRK